MTICVPQGAAEALAAECASPAWLTRCNSTAVGTAALHPALTLTGAQLSLVVGTEGGTVVKCNADAWYAAQQVHFSYCAPYDLSEL
jgi:hypothetical protein